MIIFNKLKSYFFREKGAAVVYFVIALPVVLSLCALAFDGSRILTKRNRLAHVLNEAGLAIAASNYDYENEDDADIKERNEKLLRAYIQAYLPNEEIKLAKVNVRTTSSNGSSSTTFDILAQVKVETLMPLDDLPSFSPVLYLDNIGRVTKNTQTRRVPTDFAFVVDFSGSMVFAPEPGADKRIDMLKKVVDEITRKGLDADDGSKFAILPFDVGVSVLTGKNEDGSDAVACSFVMTPKKDYDIDYTFWGKKTRLIKESAVEGYSAAFVSVDEAQRDYYDRYVRYSMGDRSMDDLSSMGICRKNTGNYGKTVPYSCNIRPGSDIYEKDNVLKIEEEFAKFVMVTSGAEKSDNNIMHRDSMDYKKTIENMFYTSSIINIPMNYTTQRDKVFLPFGEMCGSIGNVQTRMYTPVVGREMAKFRSGSFLIDLTDDLSELKKFQQMTPHGSTASLTGLLRAVPLIAKGENERKVIIVVSDGEDKEKELYHDLLETYKVCDAIRDNMSTHSPNTKATEIYFISVVGENDIDNIESGKERVAYWGEHCTGKENSITADNYDDLLAHLTSIISLSEETGFFTVDDESEEEKGKDNESENAIVI